MTTIGNKDSYLPKVELMEDDVLWKKTTKTGRIEFKPSFGIDRIEVSFQGLRQEGNTFKQTNLIRLYITTDEALWLVYKIRNGAKTDANGVLYKAPPAGTPAAALNARGIGRNGYAEYRSFQVSKGNKGWIFTGLACDGVQNDYGLFNPHKDKNGNMTGVTKNAIALTGKELLALSYAIETAINAYKMTQWFLLGFSQYFVEAPAEAAPAVTTPEPATPKTETPAEKPAAKPAEKPTSELSAEDIDFEDIGDVPVEVPVEEPKAAPAKKSSKKTETKKTEKPKEEPKKESSGNFEGYDFGEDDLPW